MELFAEGSALGALHAILTGWFPVDMEYSAFKVFNHLFALSFLLSFCLSCLPGIIFGKTITTIIPRRSVIVCFLLWSACVLVIDGLAGSIPFYPERISAVALVVGAAVGLGSWTGLLLVDVFVLPTGNLLLKKLIAEKDKDIPAKGEAS
tara:strand:+ start:1298 stop:1744 length:447 start_codon:yes stop_codon:yes gene_type:complete